MCSKIQQVLLWWYHNAALSCIYQDLPPRIHELSFGKPFNCFPFECLRVFRTVEKAHLPEQMFSIAFCKQMSHELIQTLAMITLPHNKHASYACTFYEQIHPSSHIFIQLANIFCKHAFMSVYPLSNCIPIHLHRLRLDWVFNTACQLLTFPDPKDKLTNFTHSNTHRIK